MGEDMKEIKYQDLTLNPMTMVANDWMVVCAGNQADGYNGMTVSWGHFGSIWGRKSQHNLPTILVYVRPSRYTLKFMQQEEYFTVNVLPAEQKKALALFGSKSGRDMDKFKAANLTPVFEDETTYIGESKYVFVCRKLYTGRLNEEGFNDPEIVSESYPLKDFHHFFVGEIVKVLVDDTQK